jgi:hypothetical protein
MGNKNSTLATHISNVGSINSTFTTHISYMDDENSTLTPITEETTTPTFTLIDLMKTSSEIFGMIMDYLKESECGLSITCKYTRSCYFRQADIVLGGPGMSFRNNYEALQDHVKPKIYGPMLCIPISDSRKQRYKQISELVKKRSECGRSPIKAIVLNKTTSEILDYLPSLLPFLTSLGLEGIHITDERVSQMSKLPKLSLVILEGCMVSGKLQNLTQLKELHLRTFHSKSPSSKHLGETIMFSPTLEILKPSGDNGLFCTRASAKLCTKLRHLDIFRGDNQGVPLIFEFPVVPCLETLKFNCPVTIIRRGKPFANVKNLEIDWCAIEHLSEHMYRSEITLKDQMCLLLSLVDFTHLENLCITNYECKPCLFVKLPFGARKILVTLISKKIPNSKVAKKIQLTDPRSTTTQFISKTTTITKVVHEIQLNDQHRIKEQLRMFDNQKIIINPGARFNFLMPSSGIVQMTL